MIATDFKLIPLAALCKHEATVLRHLVSRPRGYAKSLLETPEIRYAFLYYALLTHWQELLNGDIAAEDLLANRVYWYYRFSKQYVVDHDFEAGFEQEAAALLETARLELGADLVRDIEEMVDAEWSANEKEIAVPFSDFSIAQVTKQFGIQLDGAGNFFAQTAPAAVSASLLDVLRDQIPLGLAIGTEKARSELIVAPLLVEVRRQLANAISLFSGVELDADGEQGLRGTCDFLFCSSPQQHYLTAPILAVVEAKKDDFARGIGQCLAEMVAARIFNLKKQTPVSTIYGVVTTGSIWRFLRLIESTAYVDVREYHINEVERIVGIIVSMFTSSGVAKPG